MQQTIYNVMFSYVLILHLSLYTSSKYIANKKQYQLSENTTLPILSVSIIGQLYTQLLPKSSFGRRQSTHWKQLIENIDNYNQYPLFRQAFKLKFFTVLDDGLHMGLCPFGKLDNKRNQRLPNIGQSIFHFGRYDRINLARNQSVSFQCS